MLSVPIPEQLLELFGSVRLHGSLLMLQRQSSTLFDPISTTLAIANSRVDLTV